MQRSQHPVVLHRNQRVPRRHVRRGAMVVLIAVIMPILLMMAVLAVNVAYMELTRVELRTATDAAADAASRTLSLTGDASLATAVAQQAASRNMVAGEPLQLDPEDLTFGHITRPSLSSRFLFTESTENPNAVRVRGRRTEGSASGPIKFAFGAMGVHRFEPIQLSTAGQTDRDLCLVLDRSGSMASYDDDGNELVWEEGDPAPNDSRWMSAANASQAFLTAVSDTPMEELVALVTYATDASLDEDLTADYADILARIDNLSATFDGGWTNIADGIELARQALVERGYERAWAEPTIVIMTDGKHNTGSLEPEDVATSAASYGITIHTITYGSDAQQSRMIAIANCGNGQHFHAPNAAALIQAFNTIAANSPTLIVE